MAASQPNKATKKWGEDMDEEGEGPGWWEVAARKVREKEAAEHILRVRRKKEEAEEARRQDREKMRREHVAMEERRHAQILATKK